MNQGKFANFTLYLGRTMESQEMPLLSCAFWEKLEIITSMKTVVP